jgi:plastocyanin
MRRIWLLLAAVFTSINFLNAQTSHTVLVSDYQFSPKDLNITVGDTVKWQWVNGMHTTTSDSVAGVDVWDAPIDVNDQVFRYIIKTPGTHSYYCRFHVSIGMVGSIIASPLSAVKEENISADKFSLEQNYPNPFNPSTKIKYTVPQLSQVTIKIFDVLGNETGTLVNKEEPAGTYEVTWNAANLTGGVYFYQLRTTPVGGQAGSFVDTKKMILLK